MARDNSAGLRNLEQYFVSLPTAAAHTRAKPWGFRPVTAGSGRDPLSAGGNRIRTISPG